MVIIKIEKQQHAIHKSLYVHLVNITTILFKFLKVYSYYNGQAGETHHMPVTK